jgi:flagellar basal-body rod modification protein FlgD
MTTVSPVSSQPSGAAPTQSTALKTGLDYNAFLQLFMAQMKNQDPTAPTDPSQSLSQLASFSNVEQTIRLNDKLDSLVSSSNATLAASLIGKRMSSLDGSISGIATGMENIDGNFSAVLDNGRKIPLSDGYKLSSP